ncbi:Ig-like domain-containing protein [Brevibacillus sp. AG]|uniref:Ig-like domain-containing protein n=1 Tax=Brevibacillus sp. AG TaxID=3020891 RepID=UPI00232D4F3B|nr:Ig-like domain-containing protein [Brevibacillus sp. AG]MDC0763486.1 Ig-like domain-containing protein [Brevibacillus sp. AG]
MARTVQYKQGNGTQGDLTSYFPDLTNAIDIAVSIDASLNSISSLYVIRNLDGTVKYKHGSGSQGDLTSYFPDLSNAKDISVDIMDGYTLSSYKNYYAVLNNDRTVKYKLGDGTQGDITSYFPDLTNAIGISIAIGINGIGNQQNYYIARYSDGTVKYKRGDGVQGDLTNYYPTLTNTKDFATSINFLTDLASPNNFYLAAYLNSLPVIALSSTGNQVVSGTAGKRTITISGTISDADNNTVTISASINGKTKTTSLSNTSTVKGWSLSWDVVSDSIVEGTYGNIVVTADDGNGSTSSVTYTGTITVDKTNPVITISGVANGVTYQNSVAPTFSATDAGGSALSTVSATLNGATYTSGTAITTSGAKTLIVTATDNAGNQSQQTVNFSINKTPTLTLTSPTDNQTLSEGNTMAVQGSASDVDSGNVVTTKYKINNGPVRALQSGVSNGSTPISFAKSLTYRDKRLWDGNTDVIGADLAENTDHTLTVWAEDDQPGGKSTEVTRKFRVIWNRPPVIDDENRDLGTMEVPPSVNYTVTEPESNPFTVTEKLNGVVIRTFPGAAGRQETVTIPQETWLRLEPGVLHTLTIEATDNQNMSSTRVFTLTRFEDEISFEIEVPWTTDSAAKRVLLTLDMNIPAGAILIAEACNNAFDVAPTWEDISFHARYGRGYVFLNTQKTATKWGVSIRVKIEKGTASEPIEIKGFGGAFD